MALDAVLHVGFGTVLAYWSAGGAPGDDADAARIAVSAAREAAAQHGGGAVIERCPVDVKRDIDVFGELGPSLEVMRRMKQQFDPGRNLAPGRFAGGI